MEKASRRATTGLADGPAAGLHARPAPAQTLSRRPSPWVQTRGGLEAGLQGADQVAAVGHRGVEARGGPAGDGSRLLGGGGLPPRRPVAPRVRATATPSTADEQHGPEQRSHAEGLPVMRGKRSGSGRVARSCGSEVGGFRWSSQRGCCLGRRVVVPSLRLGCASRGSCGGVR